MKTDRTAEEMDGTAMFSLESRSFAKCIFLTDMGVSISFSFSLSLCFLLSLAFKSLSHVAASAAS